MNVVAANVGFHRCAALLPVRVKFIERASLENVARENVGANFRAFLDDNDIQFLAIVFRQLRQSARRETRAAWVLVGWTETWWAFTMVIVLVAYNAFRAILTLRVSALRDAEERSQVTPYFEAYWPLFRCHRIAKALMWIAIGSALFHTGYWAWTTKVWVAV